MPSEVSGTRSFYNYASIENIHQGVACIDQQCNKLADTIRGIVEQTIPLSIKELRQLKEESRNLLHDAWKIQRQARCCLIHLDPSGDWLDSMREYSLLYPPPDFERLDGESETVYLHKQNLFKMNHLVPWAERIYHDVSKSFYEAESFFDRIALLEKIIESTQKKNDGIDHHHGVSTIAQRCEALRNELFFFTTRSREPYHFTYHTITKKMQQLETYAKKTLEHAWEVQEKVKRCLADLDPAGSWLTPEGSLPEELKRPFGASETVLAHRQNLARINNLIDGAETLYKGVQNTLRNRIYKLGHTDTVSKPPKT